MSKLICERCKTEKQIEDKITDILFKSTGDYKNVDGSLLCKQCYRHFIVIFDKFMEKKI